MKRLALVLFAGILVGSLAACGQETSSTAEPSSDAVFAADSSSAGISAPAQTEEVQATPESSSTDHADSTQVLLYVGADGQFTEHKAAYTGALTETGLVPPKAVLEELAGLTGWNLDVSDIATGKGGITVCFAQTSSLFTGEASNADYRYDDPARQDRVILDSVKKTLQSWAVDPKLGNPDEVDLWFCGPDGGNLVLPDSGVIIPFDQPYEQFPEKSE